MTASFNLLDEGWIPCLFPDGKIIELGLRDTLSRAHEVKAISPAIPLERVALFRLLLAILHRNFGPADPASWRALWDKGNLDMDVLDAYFEKWRPRFFLFDDRYPFFQTAEIESEARPLIEVSFHLGQFHLASGNNATLFDHHTVSDEILLSPARAARLVVYAQSFAFGFRNFKDGPSARGINFLLLGENLFQSLMLNLVRYDREHPIQIINHDSPSWELEDSFSPARLKPDGYLDYLTWQSRKIRLCWDRDHESVRLLQVDNGLCLDVAPEPFTRNPMMQYSKNENPAAGAPPFRPLKFQEGRAVWRDSASIMELNMAELFPPESIRWIAEIGLGLENVRVNSIGISSDQGKVNFYQEELFTFPAVYLESEELVADLKTCLAHAQEVWGKLWGALSKMAEIALSPDADLQEGGKPDRADRQNLLDHIFAEYHFWSRLEALFYQLLNDLPEKGDAAVLVWQKELGSAAWHAFDMAAGFLGASPSSLKACAMGGRVLGGGLKKLFVG